MGNKQLSFKIKTMCKLYDFSKINNKVGRPRKLSDEERHERSKASKLRWYYKMKMLKQKAKSI